MAGTIGQPAGTRNITWGGVTFTVTPDKSRGGNHYIVVLPGTGSGGGKHLPAGTRLNATKKTLDLPDGSHLMFSGGKVVQNRPIAQRDKLAPKKYTQVDFYTGKTVTSRSGDDRRPSTGVANGTPTSPNQADRAQQTAAKPAGNQISQILDFGMQFRGTPYKWGGEAPGGFDCSGLLYYMFGKAGVKIPRTSGEQAQAGVGVAAKDARPGDLIALDWSSRRSGNSDVDHIGVYLGNGMMLVAPRTGDVVKVQKVDLSKAAAIRRVMPESAYQSMRQPDGAFVYAPAKGITAAPMASPRNSGPQAGGGDIASNPAGGKMPGTVATDASGNNIGVFGVDAQLDPEEAMAQYGMVAELANSNPEIKKLLAAAIEGGWSPLKFEAEVRDTKWWRTTSDVQRQVEVLKKTNPEEYRRQRQQMIDKFVITARNLGVEEGNQRIFILAERALANGWDDNEIQRFLAADTKVKETGNTGMTATTVDTLKERAAQYGVPMSQQTLQTWTTQILRGMTGPESFESYLKEQAKSLFPENKGLHQALDAGLTVSDYMAPYREITAQTLEMNPADVQLTDPNLRKALYAQTNDGVRTTMSLADYERHLRGTEAYRKTRQAQATAAEFSTRITELFGATA